MDTYEGTEFDPITLHKYLYAVANPINLADPSGREPDLASTTGSIGIDETLTTALQGIARITDLIAKQEAAAQIVLGTVALAALLLAGTVIINNKTKGEDGKLRRGRIGIQGNDLAKQSKRFNQIAAGLESGLPDLTDGGTFSFSRDTLTWGWKRTWPVLKLEGLSALRSMVANLGVTATECRLTAIKKADAAIETPGGLPQGYSKDFQGENFAQCDGSERIDIQVFVGTAFEK